MFTEKLKAQNFIVHDIKITGRKRASKMLQR